MPIYEYQCNSCGSEVEKLQRMNEDPLRDCPSCGEPELRRLISAAGFRLKGGGWYETDFKMGSKRNLHSGESSGKAAGDSKPAAKPVETGNKTAGANSGSA